MHSFMGKLQARKVDAVIGTADFKRGTIANYGATAVAVSEQAMDPALDKLFPQ
jgi:hypothetical protein